MHAKIAAADVTRQHAPSRLNARRVDRTNGRTRETGTTNADVSTLLLIRARATYTRIDDDVGASFVQKSEERILFERTSE